MPTRVERKVVSIFNKIAEYHEVTMQKYHDELIAAAQNAKDQDFILLQQFGDIFVDLKNEGMRTYIGRMHELLTGEHFHEDPEHDDLNG